jgi:phosphopantetheinyl transferase
VSDRAATTVWWRFGRPGRDGLPVLADAVSWLTAAERERAAAFRVEKRREDWLAGRLNLKALVAGLCAPRAGRAVHPAEIAIDRRPSGAPIVRLATEASPLGDWQPGAALPLAVSNSHSHGHALGAALWMGERTESEIAVGIDLEWVEPRSDLFVADFLTAAERAYVAAAGTAEGHARANAVWSAKEAVLKVLQRGLTADTWWLTCVPPPPGPALPSPPRPPALIPLPEPGAWEPFAVTCDARLQTHGLAFAGCWRRLDGFVASLAIGVR